MKKIFLVFVIGVLFSCSSDNNEETPSQQTSSLQIRILNASQYKFESITVNQVSYGDLIAKQRSTYKTHEMAYRYAFVELQINGKTYTIQPIDYVGETALENGNYTYKITVNPDPYHELGIELVKD
jgi:hypothetical protein